MIKRVKASHILVGPKDLADELYDKLHDGYNFKELAMKYSKCPSKSKGGNLGWFKRGQMVRPFENAAFSLKKGMISQPVKTEFGWHIIKVEDNE